MNLKNWYSLRFISRPLLIDIQILSGCAGVDTCTAMSAGVGAGAEAGIGVWIGDRAEDGIGAVVSTGMRRSLKEAGARTTCTCTTCGTTGGGSGSAKTSRVGIAAASAAKGKLETENTTTTTLRTTKTRSSTPAATSLAARIMLRESMKKMGIIRTRLVMMKLMLLMMMILMVVLLVVMLGMLYNAAWVGGVLRLDFGERRGSSSRRMLTLTLMLWRRRRRRVRMMMLCSRCHQRGTVDQDMEKFRWREEGEEGEEATVVADVVAVVAVVRVAKVAIRDVHATARTFDVESECVQNDEPCGDEVDKLVQQIGVCNPVHGRKDGEEEEEERCYVSKPGREGMLVSIG